MAKRTSRQWQSLLQRGIDSASEFPTGPPTTVEPGDLAFLFTDGIVEAASPDGSLFGLERTLGIVRAHQQETPDAILDALFDAVGDFSGHQLQDDITAVILKGEGVRVFLPFFGMDYDPLAFGFCFNLEPEKTFRTTRISRPVLASIATRTASPAARNTLSP